MLLGSADGRPVDVRVVFGAGKNGFAKNISARMIVRARAEKAIADFQGIIFFVVEFCFFY
jgi:hypothetical protein